MIPSIHLSAIRVLNSHFDPVDLPLRDSHVKTDGFSDFFLLHFRLYQENLKCFDWLKKERNALMVWMRFTSRNTVTND